MNILFAVFIILVAIAALGGLVACIYLQAKKPSRQKADIRFIRRVDVVLSRLAIDKNWILERDITLNLPEAESPLHIDFLLMAEKYCYCLSCRMMRGALSGDPEEPFWNWYEPDGTKKATANLMEANVTSAACLERFMTDGESEGGSFTLPILVLPDSLSVDPELLVESDGRYLFRLKYLKKGILHIEDTSSALPLSREKALAMAERIDSLEA